MTHKQELDQIELDLVESLRGHTIWWLAERTGIEKWRLSRIKSGARRPTFSEGVRIRQVIRDAAVARENGRHK